jgi:transcriptional regulator with XRE-family HTH domain
VGAVITRPTELLVVLAREALALNQEQFAKAVGSSVRTISRWEGGRSTPADFHFRAIAKLVHPVARDLATEAAARAGTTLEQLGFAGQASPEGLPVSLLLDAVVCAVASALEEAQGAPVSVASARAAAAAAFTSARALRLGIDEAAAALGAPEREPHRSTGRLRAPAPAK